MARDTVPQYVPDASVAVKWFIDEEGSENALRLKEFFVDGEISLEAPSLLSYEVASALRFHPIVRMTRKQFLKAMQSLAGLQITRDPTRSEWAAAHALALESPISIYDSIYIGFATQRQSIMVTADEALIKKVKNPETREKLLSLADLKL